MAAGPGGNYSLYSVMEAAEAAQLWLQTPKVMSITGIQCHLRWPRIFETVTPDRCDTGPEGDVFLHSYSWMPGSLPWGT